VWRLPSSARLGEPQEGARRLSRTEPRRVWRLALTNARKNQIAAVFADLKMKGTRKRVIWLYKDRTGRTLRSPAAILESASVVLGLFAAP